MKAFVLAIVLAATLSACTVSLSGVDRNGQVLDLNVTVPTQER